MGPIGGAGGNGGGKRPSGLILALRQQKAILSTCKVSARHLHSHTQ